jgi:FkbM family methyltransferase
MTTDHPSADRIVGSLQRLLLQEDIRRAKETGSWPELPESFDFLTFALAGSRSNYAQLAQDLWVLYELSRKKAGFFVEFGAGDGVLLSNTYLLETGYGWNGILAEPCPAFHSALSINRRAFISRCCVAQESGNRVTFNQTEDPHFSTIDTYTTTDEHAQLRQSGRRIELETITLRDLLQQGNAPRNIDYLSLDTEGSELEILSSFDFAEYQITLITVEHNHTPRQQEIDGLLARNGFERKFSDLSDFDGWYINRAVLQPKSRPFDNPRRLNTLSDTSTV